jgi:hypothetical protein
VCVCSVVYVFSVYFYVVVSNRGRCCCGGCVFDGVLLVFLLNSWLS